MIEITHVHAGYHGQEILKGVSLAADAGEIIAIIGPNGAGKSTVLKAVFNQCEVTNGTIRLEKRNITGIPTHELIRAGVCYVPQGRQVFTLLTVKENIEMGAFMLHDRRKLDKRMNELLQLFPMLSEKQHARANTLSGGQQQILAIARALVMKPKVLLLDEPSLGLSPIAMKGIFKEIVRISKSGVAVFLVEQNAKQAAMIAHRTYVLEDGKIKLEGGRDVLNDKRITNVYFGGR